MTIMMRFSNPELLLSLSLLFFACVISYRALVLKPRYPPGPKRHFLTGNLKELPKDGNEWSKWRELGRRLGSDLVFLKVFNKHLMAINSQRIAIALLDKKGAIYSTRPRLPYLKELAGWDWNLVLMDYGRSFFLHRRLVQQYFSQKAVNTAHAPVIVGEARLMLRSFLEAPDDFVAHLKAMAGAVILRIAYGIKDKAERNDYVELADAIRQSDQGPPGSLLVDTLPILKYLPAWFPITAKIFEAAKLSRTRGFRMKDEPYQKVKDQLAAGKAIPSMTTSLLEADFNTDGLDREDVVRNCVGVVYSAGVDTTVTALTTFILAMRMYPDIQKRAQKDLDQVVGRERLPSLDDRDSLPYITALMKETLRWQPVARLGVPHCTSEDDIHEGMLIPKGTVIFANIWAMLHDPDVYDQPETFDPERFLSTKSQANDIPDPSWIAFGFGRRVCPGRFLAESSIWINIASLLHLFSFSREKVTDDESVTYAKGLINTPSSFHCAIKPRFPGANELIHQYAVDY